MRIDVTQEDIDNGEHHHSTNCPIALATRRKIWGIRIYCITAEIPSRFFRWRDDKIINLSTKVSAWIVAYENPEDYEKVQPFSFELDVS